MPILDFNAAFHDDIATYWAETEEAHKKQCRTVPNKFQQLEARLAERSVRQGDALVLKVKNLFHNGLGIKWGDDQIRVFNAFLASCLPLIYGETWPDEKTRVLKEWDMQVEQMYSVVNMARRNGKTFVTSGTAAALLLCVPNIKIAIFSTCKRTSQMMMSATLEMIERAFDLPNPLVTRDEFVVVTKNTESVCYEGPDRTKRLLGSFPGSVRAKETTFYSADMVLLLLVLVSLSLARLTQDEIEEGRVSCQKQCSPVVPTERHVCLRQCWTAYFANKKPSPVPDFKKRQFQQPRGDMSPLRAHLLMKSDGIVNRGSAGSAAGAPSAVAVRAGSHVLQISAILLLVGLVIAA